MDKMRGLILFSVAASLVAHSLGPSTAIVVRWIVVVCTMTAIGSIVLSRVLGGDDFDHLPCGFALAAPGLALTEYVFHWHLTDFADSHGMVSVVLSVLVNMFIVGVGMVILALPVLPLIRKLR